MMSGMEKYLNASQYPEVSVPQYAIARAVKNLGKIEAIALIRAAYHNEDGSILFLEEAMEIYLSIIA